jgi:XTP/dITP diphosphohydrolase
MWTDQQLVLASGNRGKLREFSNLFKDFGTEVVPQSDLGIESPEETGLSFIENALLKARHASAVAHLPAMADDSGLGNACTGWRTGALFSAIRWCSCH